VAFHREAYHQEAYPRRMVHHTTTRSIEAVPSTLAGLEVAFIAEDTLLVGLGIPYSQVAGNHCTLAS